MNDGCLNCNVKWNERIITVKEKTKTEMILTFVEKKVAEKKNRAKEKLDEWLKELLQLRKRQAK